MTDPRRPRGKDAALPDPLDQTPSETPSPAAEEHGSQDSQLLAGIDPARDGEGDVERADQGTND